MTDQIVHHRQESVIKEHNFGLQFDIGGILHMFPKAPSLSTTHAQQVELCPKIYESQNYEFKADSLNTKWKIQLKLHDVPGEELALGTFLVLVEAKMDAGVQKSLDPCGSTEDCVRASFATKLMSNTGVALLNRGYGTPNKFCKETPNWGYTNLLTLAELWEPKNKYCLDGTLRLRIYLKIFGRDFRHVVPNINTAIHTSVSSLLKDMFKLLAFGHGSDVTIHCDGETFKLHKTILSARSNVFNKMFNTNMSESLSGIVHIQDTPANIFKYFTAYLYTSRVNLGGLGFEQLIGLVKVADKYEVAELKETCFDVLGQMVNEETCAELAVLGYLYTAKPAFREQVFEFCSKNWAKLTLDAKFRELVQGNLPAFMAHSDSNSSSSSNNSQE